MENEKLETAVKALRKAYGENVIVDLNEEVMFKHVISTGSYGLDKALGGGLVKGRIIELYGPESSGKTTIALHAIAAAQKSGPVAFIDIEHAFDPAYAKSLGVNLDTLLFSQPDYAEQTFEIIEALADAGVELIVVDSVAALSPKAEVEGDSGDSNMGLIARQMGQHLRKVTPIASKNEATIIYINQIRMKIGVFFGNPETTPGGRALKHHTSVRLDVRKIGVEKTSDEFTGTKVKVRVVKNKTAPPLREAFFTIRFGTGIDKETELVDVAVANEIIEKKGAWFYYNGTNIGQGVNKVITYLKENEDIYKEILGSL